MKRLITMLFLSFVLVACKDKEPIVLNVEDTITLTVGETVKDFYTSNQDLILTSKDDSIFTVKDDVITAIAGGSTQLIFTSNKDTKFIKEVDVIVLRKTNSVRLRLKTHFTVGETAEAQVNFTPFESKEPLVFESSDPSVMTINEEGVVKAVGIGTAIVSVTSTKNSNITSNVEVIVERVFLLKEGLSQGEEMTHNEYSFKEGINAFTSLEEALQHHPKEIMFVGTFIQDIQIGMPIVLTGSDSTYIENSLSILSNEVTVQNFNFINEGRLNIKEGLDKIVIQNNHFDNLAYSEDVIEITLGKEIEIAYNTFNLAGQNGISLTHMKGNVVSIKGNTINNSKTAIKIHAQNANNPLLSFQVMWNVIDNAETAFDLDIDLQDLDVSYVRFNEVTNYIWAAKVNEENQVDFNLNYWGGIPKLEKFDQLSVEDLEGYYVSKQDIIKEHLYNPNGPVYVEILNNFDDEVHTDDTILIEFKVLPKEVTSLGYKFTASDSEKLFIHKDNTLEFLSSGSVELIMTSNYSYLIKDSVTIDITTDIGIELIPDDTKNNLLVGESLKFNTVVFPVKFEKESLSFSVDDEEIASISNNGILKAKKAGLVTVKATLHSDETVFQTFIVEVHDSLDTKHILDFITESMVTYTTRRKMTMYGVNFNYVYDGYDSVSRLLFEEVSIDRSRMIPNCDTLDPEDAERCRLFRPGERIEMLEGLETYNDKRVHYVTVHETAGTDIGMGAKAHGDYLYNQIFGVIEVRQASWHFTMDDKALYQHIETEEMAWHAGDGRTQAGTTWTNDVGTHLGGGNAHSIGIETSVALGDDIFRIWHRTAKLSSDLLHEYHLPKTHIKFHQDFSGKVCPQSMIRAGLTWLFYELADYEYTLKDQFEGATITLISNSPDYIDSSGRVIKHPKRALTVSHTVSIAFEGHTYEKTYYSYLPGTVH